MDHTTTNKSEPALTGKAVLFTGGAGFIEGHLVDCFVADNNVHVLDDLSTGSREHVPGAGTLIEDNVSQTRNAVHLLDLVRSLRMATTMEYLWEAFDIGTAQSVPLRKLADLMKAVTENSSETVHTDPREGDIEHCHADVSKDRRLLDDEPINKSPNRLQTIGDSYTTEAMPTNEPN